jgi:DNA-binding CsgD family transcriptional regulator
LLPVPASETLAALFDLTAAEARVFVLVAGGRTQKEVAGDPRHRTGTVKTHLLRVFSKTDARRQPDLVRLAMPGAALDRRLVTLSRLRRRRARA